MDSLDFLFAVPFADRLKVVCCKSNLSYDPFAYGIMVHALLENDANYTSILPMKSIIFNL